MVNATRNSGGSFYLSKWSGEKSYGKKNSNSEKCLGDKLWQIL